MRRSLSNVILWLLVLILLAFNVALLFALNRARLLAIRGLTRSEAVLADFSNEVINYQIEVNETIPVSADIPFRRTVEVPIKTNVPIDTVFNVPLATPLGVIELDVPLKTEIPIDLVVPVTLSETVTIETEVPLALDVPITIDVAQTPIRGYLQEAEEMVSGLRAQLEDPLGRSLRPGP